MRIYAARDKNTDKLVTDLTTRGNKFWLRRSDCEAVISRYNCGMCHSREGYDLELVVYELVEVKE